MRKTTKLTAAQKARLPHYIDRWSKIGLSTHTDQEQAATSIAGMYQLADLPAPKVVHVPCALSGALAAAVYGSLEDSAVRSAVRSAGGVKWSSWLWGNQWAGYGGCAEFFKKECGANVPPAFLEYVEHTHYTWLFEKVCFVSDRPVAIKVDDAGRSHSEVGPAVEYATGWGPYCWHGTVVPLEWITGTKPLTAAQALHWENVEQRRAACEIVGWSNILTELNAKTIDVGPNKMVGELLEVEIPGIGRERFLRVMCGTGREFALPVPPEMERARQAQAWLNFTTEDNYLPEIRT